MTQMQESTAGEVIHLFKTMKRFGALCSLEIKLLEQADPLVGVALQYVDAEYLETSDFEGRGDTVVVYLADNEYAFNLADVKFAKDITGGAIDILIAGNSYSAWFSCRGMPPKGIEAASKYISDREESMSEVSTDGDMWHATLDVCIGLEKGEYDHIEATSRIFAAFADYMLKVMQEGRGEA